MRVGIHTGELEGHRDDLSGIALHIGQRVSTSAQPNEILVSSTVRDLALGSGTEFIDRGEHELQGLPGTWHLLRGGAPRPDEDGNGGRRLGVEQPVRYSDTGADQCPQ